MKGSWKSTARRPRLRYPGPSLFARLPSVSLPLGDTTDRMMHHLPVASFRCAARLSVAILAWLLAAPALPAALQISPATISLDSPETTQQLLVTGGTPAAPIDLT